MPRPKIRLFYIEEIQKLLDNGIDNTAVITKALEKLAVARGWTDYPVERTVRRYIKNYAEGSADTKKKRTQFRWPESMGEMESQIAWEHSRTALDCLKFYLSDGYERPSNGLVQWFVRVSLADPEQEVQQRALMAEVFWCVEILEKTHGFDKPSTEEEELKLIFQTWKKESPPIDTLLQQFSVSKFMVPKEGFEIALELPLFAEKIKEYFKRQEVEEVT